MRIVMRLFLHRRPALALCLALATSGVAAGSLAAKAAPLRLTAPGRALQGKVVAVSANSASFTCKLSVRFANGEEQSDMLPTLVQKRKVVWQWHVPEFAPAGPARLTVACPGPKATRSIIVVGGLVPPRVEVVKKGYSVRVRGSSESVSYGLVLQNTSPNGNALDVAVLVNFVLPDNHLIGTASAQVPIINAGSTYNVGGQISFGGAPTITRLEVVVDPGGRARSAKSFSPALENVHLVPNLTDSAWLGSIEGDLINVHPSLTLASSNLSCVVLDAGGNVIGGGLGSGYFKLLPGTRSFFKITGGLDPIPFNKAASVAISVLPQYEQPATP
jgi:hypothetical protein